jgi:HK97 family phage prohead protease
VKNELRYAVSSVRAGGADDGPVLEGKLSYNTLSEPNVPTTGCREMVLPGAFKKTLDSGARIWCFWQHQADDMALGSTENDSLKLFDGPDALRFQLKPNMSIQLHREAYEAVRSGLVSDISFGFAVNPGGDVWDECSDEKGQRFVRRQLKDCALFEVSLVNVGAYQTNTGITAVRSLCYRPSPPSLPWNPQREFIMTHRQPRVHELPIDKRNRARLAEFKRQIDADNLVEQQKAKLQQMADDWADDARREEFQACRYFVFVHTAENPREGDGIGYFRVMTEDERADFETKQAVAKFIGEAEEATPSNRHRGVTY